MFNNPKTVILLKAHSLDIYNLQTKSVNSLDLPTTLSNYLEVFDPEGYEKLLTDFFTPLELPKKPVVLAIAEEVCFSKVLPKEDSEADKQFLKKVPIGQNHLLSKIIQREGEGRVIFAVNKGLFLPIVNVLKNLDIRISSVIPLNLITSDNITALNGELAEQILDSNNILKTANLLEGIDLNQPQVSFNEKESGEEKEEKNAEEQGSKKQLILIIMTILLFSFSGIVVAMSLNKASVKQNVPYSFPVTSELTTEESSKSAESSPSGQLNRAELKVQVLNGSEISGQAAKVEEQLLELGYKEVIIGNAPEVIEISQVEFNSSINKTTQDEVLADLKTMITTIVKSSKETSEQDFTITIGKDVSLK